MDESTSEVESGNLFEQVPAVAVDLVLVFLFVVASDWLLIRTSPEIASVRALFAFPLLFFVPGYLLVATLFPGRHSAETSSRSISFRPGRSTTGADEEIRVFPITWMERLALSFGLSVAIIPLIGIVVGSLASSLTLYPVLLGVNSCIMICWTTAIIRRYQLESSERFRLPYGYWIRLFRSSVTGHPARFDTLVTVLLVSSVIVAGATMGWVLIAPQQGETYTSATVLGETEGGELVADGYPTNITLGDSKNFPFRLENSEGVETTYIVDVELERVETNGTSMTVTESEDIRRERVSVGPSETWETDFTVTPSFVGTDLRLSYYVYKGGAPDEPTSESAYRHLYIWMNVTAQEP